jgi:hypothetical protein
MCKTGSIKKLLVETLGRDGACFIFLRKFQWSFTNTVDGLVFSVFPHSKDVLQRAINWNQRASNCSEYVLLY